MMALDDNGIGGVLGGRNNPGIGMADVQNLNRDYGVPRITVDVCTI